MVNHILIGLLSSTVIATSVTAVSVAETSVIGTTADHSYDHKPKTQEAHVHGAWELFAALDDKQLSVTVKGPVVDVVGFERPPIDENEHTALKELHTQLIKPETLFLLSERAGCSLSEPAQIAWPEGFSTDPPSHEDDHEYEHDDDHHSDHDGHDDHTDDHHEDHHEHHDEDHADHDHDEEHDDHDHHASDLEVTYVFTCNAPTRLQAISMTGFDRFPAIENVDAVFLADAKQVARRLQRGSETLKIN